MTLETLDWEQPTAAATSDPVILFGNPARPFFPFGIVLLSLISFALFLLKDI